MGNEEIKIFPQKINKSSYIINTMEFLAQAYNFAFYFIKQNFQNNNSHIILDFKDYMENLWTDDNKIFSPTKFIKTILNVAKKYFSLEEELEPYLFYDLILEELNKKLNGFDKEITKYHQNLIKKYEEEEKDIQNFLKDYIEKNNSIVSKIFYGIMKISKTCDYCHTDKSIEYEKYNMISIDIYDFWNNMSSKKNNFSLEEFIKDYFDDLF